MRRVTDSEIEEMRARWFDRVTIQEACEARDRGQIADQLIARIDQAFDGVVLGHGVGLGEARGLDDLEDEEMLAARRSLDEKADWRMIPADALNAYHGSLAFFDAEGMKFHLPAYMTAELRVITVSAWHSLSLGLMTTADRSSSVWTLPNGRLFVSFCYC